MDNLAPELIPVADLPDRFGVSRSQVYARLAALKERDGALVPEQQGRKAYVSDRLLAYLDSMHVLISQGQSLQAAADLSLGIQSTRPVSLHPTAHRTTEAIALTSTPSELQASIGQLAEAIAALAPAPPTPDPLAKYRQLDEIAIHGWELPTAELAKILGHSPKGGARYGFTFEKVGTKGRSYHWRVVRR